MKRIWINLIEVFGHVFKGLENLEEIETAEIPEDWLKLLNEKYLTEERKNKLNLWVAGKSLWKS